MFYIYPINSHSHSQFPISHFPFPFYPPTHIIYMYPPNIQVWYNKTYLFDLFPAVTNCSDGPLPFAFAPPDGLASLSPTSAFVLSGLLGSPGTGLADGTVPGPKCDSQPFRPLPPSPHIDSRWVRRSLWSPYMQMMPEKMNAHPVTVKNARPESSIKFFRFMPYRDATNAPDPMPRVPIENLRSRSIREFPVVLRSFPHSVFPTEKEK